MKNNEYAISQDKIRAIRKYTRNLIMVSGAFLFSLLTCLIPDIYAENVQLTIIHSNNINGHLFPCPT